MKSTKLTTGLVLVSYIPSNPCLCRAHPASLDTGQQPGTHQGTPHRLGRSRLRLQTSALLAAQGASWVHSYEQGAGKGGLGPLQGPLPIPAGRQTTHHRKSHACLPNWCWQVKLHEGVAGGWGPVVPHSESTPLEARLRCCFKRGWGRGLRPRLLGRTAARAGRPAVTLGWPP